ncbi:MAG: hypothetical protein ACRBBM_03865 [Pseudomonadaceae bacterium]
MNGSAAAGSERLPYWLKFAYSLMVTVIVVVYWIELGPVNFLWFSDIALIALVAALWWENRLISSTMAVSVLLIEIGWVIDFLSAGQLLGGARYVFENETALHIRVISALFHMVLPAMLIYLLIRLGYDRRAFWWQTLLMLVVVPVSYVLSPLEENINWVFGPGEPQQLLPALPYLGLLMLVFALGVYLPSHLLFSRFLDGRSD